MRTNLGLAKIERELQDALNHLYNPTYQPSSVLQTVLNVPSPTSVENLQARLILAIQVLVPAPSTPSVARSQRLYDVLVCRYVQKLTQEETAERLGITARHLRREQAQAIHALAKKLWDDYRSQKPMGENTRSNLIFPEAESPEWLLQVRQEVSVLERGALLNIADVNDTIGRVVELLTVVADDKGVTLQASQVPKGLTAAVHPAELRQILVRCVSELIRSMSGGQVNLSAEKITNSVNLSIAASPANFAWSPKSDLVGELLSSHGGSITSTQQDAISSMRISLPLASFRVVVVDDNPDLVHFYQRYVQGTHYQIIPLREGMRTLEVIQASAPDVVVLDVMLPDADGWELLSHLHNHPATRAIPVIVCSVVREEELALSLGATLYVPKPVRRQDFIQALDRVRDQAGANSPPASVSNATIG